MRRREMLRSIGGGLAAVLAATAYPTLRFWWRPRAASVPEAWSDAGPVDELPEQGWAKRTLRVRSADKWRADERAVTVYMRRRGDAIEALTAVCPHTGCLVRKLDRGFACPCHESAFDSEGESVAGPSPRPLDRLEARVEKGRARVRYQRFRPGLAEPRALGA